jgi:hypothetical protein
MAKFGYTKNETVEVVNPYLGVPMVEVKDAATRLIMTVGSYFFNEPQYYGNKGDISLDIIETATEIANGEHPEDLLIIANWLRSTGIRTTPMVLLAIAAHELPTKKFTRRYIKETVKRVDDVMQIFAAYIALFGKPIPNALRRGISDALSTKSDWEIMRYAGGTSHPNLKDVLRMVDRHGDYPVNSVLYGDIMFGTFNSPNAAARRKVALAKTFDEAKDAILEARLPWEPVVSKFGGTKEVWEFLIENNLLGSMAMLRNIRNFEDVNIDQKFWIDIEKSLSRIGNGNMTLPVRYLMAYRSATTKVAKDIISRVVELIMEWTVSLENTAILIDLSGSMYATMSTHSQATFVDNALLLGVMIGKGSGADIVTFSDDALFYNGDTFDSVIYTVDKLSKTGGGATYAYKAFNILKKKYDRIIMLSDMQCYGESYYGGESVVKSFNDYKNRTGADPQLYSINMSGYQVSQFDVKNPKVHLLSGWSDKIIDMILDIENPARVPTIEVLREKYRVG